MTFTNKAAEEMQSRVTDLLLRAGVPPARPWISTFHSLCARLLRREAVHAGLPKDFAIYDDDDQIGRGEAGDGTAADRRRRTDAAQCAEPDQLRKESWADRRSRCGPRRLGPDMRKVADIFVGYEELLKNSKAVDFDDLLLRSARLLRESDGCAGTLAGAVCLHSCGRISGHQSRAV